MLGKGAVEVKSVSRERVTPCRLGKFFLGQTSARPKPILKREAAMVGNTSLKLKAGTIRAAVRRPMTHG